MADQRRWFKVWTSIIANAHFAEMSLEDIGRWALLGAATALDGDGGSLGIPGSGKELCRLLRVTDLDAAKVVLKRIASVSFEESKNRDAEHYVTWRNWHKYQEDSTAAQRMKTLRSKRRREEKRIRREKKKPSPDPSLPLMESGPSANGWGSPDDLKDLYNAETADECAAAETLSPARRTKCTAYLKDFPERSFWLTVFQATKRSRFLRGLVAPDPGYKRQRTTIDFFLRRGKQDGIENCVKAFEGWYDD